MWFIWTLDSHELLGPFTTKERAEKYAKEYDFKSYQFVPDAINQHRHIHQALILVPSKDR